MARNKKDGFYRVNRKSQKKEIWVTVDLCARNDGIKNVQSEIGQKYIGQLEAVESVLDAFTKITSGLGNGESKRPFGVFLFLGPTGVGKTELAKLISEFYVGKYGAMTRLDCSELADKMMLSRLTGASNGYIGFDEEVLLAQNRIDEPYIRMHFPEFYKLRAELKKIQAKFERERDYLPKDGNEAEQVKKKILNLVRKVDQEAEKIRNSKKPSVVLFDEIEKAHPAILKVLLQILEEGELTHNQGTTSFRDSIVIMTSNLGVDEMQKALKGTGVIGFAAASITEEEKIEKAKQTVIEVWEKNGIFSPEMRGRIAGYGKVVVFQPLSPEELKQIVELQMNVFCNEIMEKKFPGEKRIVIQYDNDHEGEEGLESFVVRMANPAYGARGIAGALRNHVFDPLRHAISAKQIVAGDVVHLYVKDGKVDFFRAERTEPTVAKKRTTNCAKSV